MNPVVGNPGASPPVAALDAAALLDVRVRLSVEIGRVRMSLARAVALAQGAIIDLDRGFDEPVAVYVNGRHFGSGRLLASDGDWALRLEQIDADDPDPAALAAPAEEPEEPGAAGADPAAAEAPAYGAEPPAWEADAGVEQASNADTADPADAD